MSDPFKKYYKHVLEGWIINNDIHPDLEPCLCGHDKNEHRRGCRTKRGTHCVGFGSNLCNTVYCSCTKFRPKFVEVTKEEYKKYLKEKKI